jgi:putative tricarboxylic transport membrane protein
VSEPDTIDPATSDDPASADNPTAAGTAAGTGSTDAATGTERPGRNWGELALTALLLVIGGYLIIGGSTISVPGSSNTVGPRFFPYLVGGATVVLAVVLGVRILRGDQGPGEEGEDIDPDATTSWWSVVIIAVAFLAHALLINVVGWPLAVTAMFGVVAWSLGPRSGRTGLGLGGVVRPLLAGGIASVIIWLIFVKALGVALPGGILLELATNWIR